MQGFPHRYSVNASAKKDGLVLLDSPGERSALFERFAGYHPNWQIGRMIAELMDLPVAGTSAGREQFAIDQSGKPSKPLE